MRSTMLFLALDIFFHQNNEIQFEEESFLYWFSTLAVGRVFLHLKLSQNRACD